LDQRELRIVGKGIKSFSFSRDLPWGPSVSVNKYTIEAGAISVLKIEMQSGDELIARGESFFVSN